MFVRLQLRACSATDLRQWHNGDGLCRWGGGRGRARGREGVTLHIYTIQTPDFLLLAITQLLPPLAVRRPELDLVLLCTSYTPTGDKAAPAQGGHPSLAGQGRAGREEGPSRCTQSSPYRAMFSDRHLHKLTHTRNARAMHAPSPLTDHHGGGETRPCAVLRSNHDASPAAPPCHQLAPCTAVPAGETRKACGCVSVSTPSEQR